MKKVIFTVFTIVLIGFIVWYLQNQSTREMSVSSIEWTEEEIVDQDGKTLLLLEDVPDNIDVSEESSFGVEGVFSGALLSPDGKWLAVSRVGAAHSGAWLYELSTENIYPAAFQYGGGLDLLEWSPDSNFLAIMANSPAEIDAITIIDRQRVGSFVNSFLLEVGGASELQPPFSYNFQGWQEPNTLCFDFQEEEYCIDLEDEQFLGN